MEKHPQLKIVHVTTPLEEKTKEWKKTIKNLIGREDTGALLNLKRNEYNDLMRKKYGNEFNTENRSQYDIAQKHKIHHILYVVIASIV